MNKEPILVVLAAGLGSRYNGFKQIDPMDEFGNILIDFSLYDAIKAGFKRAVFIIKEEHLEVFKKYFDGKDIEINYAFQKMDKLPKNCTIDENREKPLGTAHAIYCAKEYIDAPFAVINADDFYGKDSYVTLYKYLSNLKNSNEGLLVGYILKNTLTDNGVVTRGICKVEDGILIDINETPNIMRKENKICSNNIELDENSIVSMNMWAFSEDILNKLENYVEKIINTKFLENPLKEEVFLPTYVGELIANKEYTIKVENSFDKWFGVTYKEDKEFVRESVNKLRKEGLYPDKL